MNADTQRSILYGLLVGVTLCAIAHAAWPPIRRHRARRRGRRIVGRINRELAQDNGMHPAGTQRPPHLRGVADRVPTPGQSGHYRGRHRATVGVGA